MGFVWWMIGLANHPPTPLLACLLQYNTVPQAHGQTFNDTLGALPDELRANVTQFLETGRNN